jgi:hypothetical protein
MEIFMLISYTLDTGYGTRRKAILILLLLIALFIIPISAFAALNIDGILDEPDWEDAQIFRDFVVINPLTYDTPRLATKAHLLSTPEGIAVAFICEQPADEPRTRTISQRDAMLFDSDYVTLMIDFDGTGKIAYEFSVSISGSYRDGVNSGEIFANYDWDGLWEHAVNEDPYQWTVEIMLPWSIAVMREGDGESRILGVSFQRSLYFRSETFAFPEASPDRARYISEFAKVRIVGYSDQDFDLWPYVTVLSDLVRDSIKGKAGIDLFWKPSNRFQVTGTLNPDFGQVESDDLVIDFSATEVFFSDKRPFFTENQSIFQLSIPIMYNIFYTRRIGGPSDDSGRASNIDAAVKIIGSAGYLDYGFFAAQEADDAGRSFYAGRLVLPAENWSLGAMSTYVERPFLDRTALVNVIDYDVMWGESLRLEGKILSSDIDSSLEEDSGYGIYANLAYNPSEHWNLTTTLTRYNDRLDINDMGYMGRNNFEEFFFSGSWVQTDFPEDSRSASVSWSLRTVIGQNTDGDKFPIVLDFSRREKLNSGANITLAIEYESDGYDDLVSRGNGLVRLNERWDANMSYRSPRRGSWAKNFNLMLFQEGIEDWGVGLRTGATWFYRNNLNIDFSVSPRWSRDWLIWVQGDQLASFNKRQVTGEIGASWFPAEDHEIRLRTQWYVINADAEQGYRIGPGGRLVASNDPINSFSMINFGLQLRYKYEIAPLSDFYFVYSRGGIDRVENSEQSTLSLLGESTGLRNADQILIKLRYRF